MNNIENILYNDDITTYLWCYSLDYWKTFRSFWTSFSTYVQSWIDNIVFDYDCIKMMIRWCVLRPENHNKPATQLTELLISDDNTTIHTILITQFIENTLSNNTQPLAKKPLCSLLPILVSLPIRHEHIGLSPCRLEAVLLGSQLAMD